MLSAVSSLLPSALQFNHDANSPKGLDHHSSNGGETPTAAVHSMEPTSSSMDPKQVEQQEGVDELGARRKRPPPMNETLIIVRPPPAKSNHPLNLQLQLVPPAAPRVASGSTAQTITSRQSMESMNNPLERIPTTGTTGPPSPPATAGPNRSVTDISLYSTYSTASLTSNVSSVSSASTTSARRIVPLYNLSAHNVMQNIVLDAGTDAKVAKFSKKGLELIDLGFLELFEVWDSSLSLNMPLESLHANRESIIKTPPKQEKSPETSVGDDSADASSSSLPESDTPRPKDFAPRPVVKEEKETPKKGARKVFGRLFRKKDSISNPAQFLEIPQTHNGLASALSRLSVEKSQQPMSPPPTSTTIPEAHSQAISLLLPPVLDLQATLIKSKERSRRPTAFVWVIRKWLKKNRGEGLKAMFSAAGDKMSSFSFPGLNLTQDDRAMEVEVRFDWTRNDKRKSKRGRQSSTLAKRSSVISGEGGSINRVPSVTETKTQSERSSPDHESESVASHNPAVESDGGDESDPEDSENPWTCMMTIRRLHPLTRPPSQFLTPSPTLSNIRPSTSGGRLELTPQPQHGRPLSTTSNISSDPRDDNTSVRVKIASLHPAPHHPKIVAQLKVPYPLPDVDVHQGIVYRRKGKRSEKEAVRKEQSFMLSAEEIKDIICTTAFWMIVREGFGGVGKEKRKGDGWRIRA